MNSFWGNFDYSRVCETQVLGRVCGQLARHFYRKDKKCKEYFSYLLWPTLWFGSRSLYGEIVPPSSRTNSSACGSVKPFLQNDVNRSAQASETKLRQFVNNSANFICQLFAAPVDVAYWPTHVSKKTMEAIKLYDCQLHCMTIWTQ